MSKDCLRYGWKGSEIIPYFLSPLPRWESLAQALLDASGQSLGSTFELLDEQWLGIEASAGKYRKVAKGLRSMIEKKIEFMEIDAAQMEASRQAQWKAQVELLRTTTECPSFPVELINLYGDLDSRRKVSKVPVWSSSQILNRYNLALIQGLLLHSDRMRLDLDGVNPRMLRYFWRYLRFFGLLVRVEGDLSQGKVSFFIEGPLQEWGGVIRYRMRMAAIAGVLPNLEHWKLRAELTMDQKRAFLNIDSEMGLKSHYRPFFDYIPEELRVFCEHLNDELKDWELDESDWPKPVSIEKWFLPDLCYQHKSGMKINIHVYFCAQKELLLRHLQALGSNAQETFILIEKPLMKYLPKDMDFQVLGFSGMPTVRPLMKKLKESLGL